MTDLDRAIWRDLEPAIGRAWRRIKETEKCDDVVALDHIDRTITAILIYEMLWAGSG